MKLPTLLMLFVAGAAHAAGFAIDAQSARANGMGSAYAAVADDPSAVFYNPAGLVGPTGLDLQLGDTLIVPMLSYRSPSGSVTQANVVPSPPPHLYARYGLNERVAFGLGVFTPFGASSSWPEDWPGQFRSRSSRLQTYYVSPVAVVQPHERVKVGAGVQLVRGTVVLERDLDFVDAQGTALLGGSAWGFGFAGGLQFEVVKNYLEVGASARSGGQLNFVGRAHFEDVPPEAQSRLKDQGVRTSVKLPDLWALGVKSRPLPQLLLALDARVTSWSRFSELRLEFDDPELNSVQEKLWRDTVSVHLGGEYELSPALRARAGLVWDPSPSPASTLTPDLPDGTRYKFALGAGYSVGALQVDAAYQFVLLAPTQSEHADFPGTYSGTAHLVSLTLGYRVF